MDSSWNNAYRGDTGVPHTDPQQLVATWGGSFALASVAWLQTHTSNLTRNLKFNWGDKAIMLDQQKWKRIFDKKRPTQTALSNSVGSPAK